MSNRLVSLVKRGNTRAFHDAVRDLLEKDQTISLEGATFKELTLTGFDFSDVDLTHCAFENCTLSEVQFVNSILVGAFFDAVTLLHCHFEGGDFEGWALDASTIGRCSFKDVSFDQNEWTDCRLNDCEFDSISSQALWMERVTFQAGHWKGFQVEGGTWTHVTLRDISITDLELGDEIEIKNCYYVDSALAGSDWPEGFLQKSGQRKTL